MNGRTTYQPIHHLSLYPHFEMHGRFDLCILLMFSPAVLELTEEAHRFLFTVAQVGP